MQTDFDTAHSIVERREISSPALVAPVGRTARSFRMSDFLLPLIAIAVWMLTHSFQGIYGDANVYIGQALAKLDPHGLGRDMIFVNDGQLGFSLFPLLVQHLVATLGTLTAIWLFAVMAMVCWITALSVFARQFVGWRAVPVVVIFVGLLPTIYGWPWHFHYSEITAIPRPFSEAFVLAALAALVAGRTWLALAALVVASLIHPLMALAGWSVFCLVLCREDVRWRIGVAVAIVAVLAAAAAGAPLLVRLLTPIAPDLKALALGRSPILILKSWPIESYYPIITQVATLAVATSFYKGRGQTIFVAIIAVVVVAFAAQFVLGDEFGLILILQAQLWRVTWLMAVLAAIALALLALRLRDATPREHAIFALLAMAWVSYDSTGDTVAFAVAAALLHFGFARSLSFSWRLAAVVWSVAILWTLYWVATCLISYVHFVHGLPADGWNAYSYFFNRQYAALPISALALMLYFASPSRLLDAGEAILLAGLAVFLVFNWDGRSAFQRLVDANTHPQTLVDKLASRPGEVLWVNGLTESWFLAGRPQWASPQQGVSSIFSPRLGRQWRARMQFLIAQGLADPHILSKPKPLGAAADLPLVTRTNLAHLCARDDAPAWVIAPEWGPKAIASDLEGDVWSPGISNYLMTDEADGYAWHRVTVYAILPCAGTRL